MPIKIKAEFKGTVVGFNNSALPLGERSDLHLLLDDVIGEGGVIRNQYIADMFEQLPSKEELTQFKIGNALRKAEVIKDNLEPPSQETLTTTPPITSAEPVSPEKGTKNNKSNSNGK